MTPAWPTFAAWAEALAPDDIQRGMADISPAWCFIRTLGPIRRDRSVSFAVSYGAPFGRVDHVVTGPPGTYKRWHGYRYVAIGALVEHDRLLAPGIPYFQLADDDGRPGLSAALIVQWAAPELGAAYAEVTWNPTTGRLKYGSGKLGTAMTHHQAKLVVRGQQLIEVVSTRGRPIETPLEARERLMDGARTLIRRREKVDRDGLSRTVAGCTSIDGIADLLDRAQWNLEHLREEANKTHHIGPGRS